MKLRWTAITCDVQRLLTKSQMWGKWWHATLLAGGWVGVRSGREKHLPGKTPQTAPPGQDLNVVNAATKVDPRAMAEPGSSQFMHLCDIMEKTVISRECDI